MSESQIEQNQFTSGETIAERRIMGQLYVINRRLREFDMEFEEFCSLIRPAKETDLYIETIRMQGNIAYIKSNIFKMYQILSAKLNGTTDEHG